MSNIPSPFRYPGGKSQLYKFIKNTLTINNINGTYIEPFAGGAGLALKLLFNNDVNNIWINDFDKSIYSVWHAILFDHKKLIKLINDVPFDSKNSLNSDNENLVFWNNIKEMNEKYKNHQNSIENAYSTLMLNRMNVSGIISGGPIGGKKQNNYKLNCRFNKTSLITKINDIHKNKDKIKLTRIDAFKLISKLEKEITNQSNAFIFFDPPYFNQGSNLYMSHFDEDAHKNFAKIILNQKNDFNWIVTYDDTKEIINNYSMANQKFRYYISYSASTKTRRRAPELLFSSKNTKLENFEKIELTKV